VLIHVVRNIFGTNADKSETRSSLQQARGFCFKLIVLNTIIINVPLIILQRYVQVRKL
jgi:hypothetical protein